MTELALRVVSKTSKALTLAWDLVPAAAGFRYTVDGRVSHTWNGATTSAQFYANAQKISVEAVGVVASGTWPAVTPTPSGVVVAPPVGPLTVHDGAQAADFWKFLYQWDGVLDGGEISNVDLRNYVRYGLGLMSWNPDSPNTPGKRWSVHDGKVSNVHANPSMSLGGTAEAGAWIGQTADFFRWVFGPGNGWMDLWTGAHCDGSTFRDLLFQHPEHVAAYLEHVSANLLFERIVIGQGSDGQSNPINVEWTYGGVGSSKITFRAFDIYCPKNATGIFVDAGPWGNVFADQGPKCRFWGPGDALGLPNNLAGPTSNVVNMPNISFENAGKKVYYHDNAIGAVAGARAVQSARRLHPHTLRMDSSLRARLELIHDRPTG